VADLHPIARAAASAGSFGVVYLALAIALGVREISAIARLARR
jgi:hypothetical protein